MSALSGRETKTEHGMRSRRRTSALGSVVFHLSCFAVLYEASAFSASNTRTTATASHRRSAFLGSNPWSTAHRTVSSAASVSRLSLYPGNEPESSNNKVTLYAQTDASAKTSTSSEDKSLVSTTDDDDENADPLKGSPPLAVTLEGDDYSYSDAIQRTLGWVGAAIVFGGGVWALVGSATGEEFFAGYLVEQSLSVDNLFVFLMLFQYFKVPLAYQDRVLNWGIYGAVVMRAVMIGVGAAALKNFRGILLVFAAILVYSSVNVFIGGDDDDEDPSNNSIVKFSRSLINSTDDFDGDRFFTLVDGVRQATPLFICMIAVEISDVVFAVDSIPAVFGVTEVRFIDAFNGFTSLLWMI
jgi:TerC family integral membrane protein